MICKKTYNPICFSLIKKVNAKRKLFALLWICLFLGNIQLYAQNPCIFFEIRNEVRVDTTYSFDVFMYSDSVGTFHNKGQTYISYDTAAFGADIVFYGKVGYSPLDLTDDSLGFLGNRVAKYRTLLNDNVNQMAVTWIANFENICPASPFTHAEVDTMSKGLYHFDIAMKDTTINPNLVFNNRLSQGQQFYSHPNPPVPGTGCDLQYCFGNPQPCVFNIDLGADTLLCPGDTVMLDASYSNATYKWSDNSTDSTLTISSAGTYWVEVYDGGCSSRDSVVVQNRPPASANLTATPPGGLCDADTVLLSIDPNYSNIIWSTGDTLNAIQVSGATTYRVEAIDSLGCVAIDSIDLMIMPQDTQWVQLRKGWSIISTYLCLTDTDLDSLFNAIQADVWIVKDETGQAFIPGMVNTIGNWQGDEGYQIKTYKDTVIQLVGQKTSPTYNQLALPQGWSLIAYLRDSALAINPALGASVLNNLYVLKGQDGKVFVPSFGIDQIGNMEPGQGYWIRMIASDTLLYPARNGLYATNPVPELQLQHFPSIAQTSANATLVFPLDMWEDVLKPGDEIGAFSHEGILVGTSVFNGTSMAMAIWEDDPATPNRDGLITGEGFILKRWNYNTAEEFVLPFQSQEADQNYGTNEILVLAPTLLAEIQNRITWFPNPAEGRVHIDFSFSSEQNILVELFDSNGRLILEKKKKVNEGPQRMSMDVSTLARGVYTWRVRSEEQVKAGKLILIGN